MDTSRPKETRTFFQSFANQEARQFVADIMRRNYALAILEHHPQRETLDQHHIQHQCDQLVHVAFRRIEEIEHQPEQLFPLFAQLSRSRPQRDAIWFDEFLEAYYHYKHARKLQSRYQKIKAYLYGRRYADVGCGGGDFVAFLKQQHPEFQELHGIDVMDWRTEAVKEEIGFQLLDFSQPDAHSAIKYDTMTCLAVLHHVGNTDAEQGVFLQNLKKSLNPGGRLVIEEDVILPSEQISQHDHYQQQISRLLPQQPVLADFLAQSPATQRDSIILVDFLANALAVGVPEMAFPCGFRSINSWRDLFEKNGFKLLEVKIAGFVPGNFNQSSHVYFVLEA